MRASYRVARFIQAFKASIRQISLFFRGGGIRPLPLFRVGHGLHDNRSLKEAGQEYGRGWAAAGAGEK